MIGEYLYMIKCFICGKNCRNEDFEEQLIYFKKGIYFHTGCLIIKFAETDYKFRKLFSTERGKK